MFFSVNVVKIIHSPTRYSDHCNNSLYLNVFLLQLGKGLNPDLFWIRTTEQWLAISRFSSSRGSVYLKIVNKPKIGRTTCTCFYVYRQPSLNAVILTAILHICDPEMANFLEPILWCTVLGIFICKFIICEPIFGVPISRIHLYL